MKSPLLYLFFVAFNIYLSYQANLDDESCQSYAGGSVYPYGTDPEKTDHKIQYIKAVSKLIGYTK